MNFRNEIETIEISKELFSLQRKHGCRNTKGELVNYKIRKRIQKDIAHREERGQHGFCCREHRE